MSLSEFDRIFDSGYDAVDLFTNRSSEHEIFARSLENHSVRVQWSAATLEHAERNNVLTFYGVGGIGKTELSRRLEKWVNRELPEPEQWGRPPEIDQAVRTVRIDFHGSANVDAEDIVLRLRAALAQRRLRFPAFDIGVSAWWALAHSGIPMPDLKRSTGFDVKGQITDTLNSLISAGFWRAWSVISWPA